MEIRDIEVFLAVAAELHFGRAAERLHVSQPMVSQAVVRLERQLHVRLFDRSSRVVRLTGAGTVLRQQAQRVLDEVEALRQLAARSAEGHEGHIRMGVISSMGWRLQLILVEFAKAQPDVTVTVSTARTKEKIARLRSHDLNLAVLRQGRLSALPGRDGDLPDDLQFARLWSEPLLAVLPQRHPLADLPAIPAHALQGMPVMLVPRPTYPDIYDNFLALCRDVGLEPTLGPAFLSAEDALANVAASGNLWFPMHARHNALIEGGQSPGVVARPFADIHVHADTVLAWNGADPGPAALHLVEIAEQIRDRGGFDLNP